ncbi:MAG: hypothetical protein RTU63_07510 [Candidatus Thorarchaeota archaeon]
MSTHRHPRKGEFGQPSFKCRYCGKEREYDPDYWLIGSFCSFSCHAAHGLYVYACFSIMFTNITFLTLILVLRYSLALTFGPAILTIVFALLTVLSLAGVAIGHRVRKETPRQYQHRESYDPKIRA